MAESRSLTQAAEELYLSPSSLTSRIKSLEVDMGKDLFHLEGRNLRLSQFGNVFLPYAKRIVKMAEEMEREINKIEKGMPNTFVLGANPSVTTYVLPQLIKRFQKKFPLIEIELLSCPGHMVHEYALQGIVDLGVVQTNEEKYKNLSYQYWFTDRQALIVSSNHNWAKSGAIGVEALQKQPLLAFSRESFIWRRQMEWLERQGVAPWIGMELAHIETIKEILLQDYGYAFLPLKAVEYELQTGQLQEIQLKGAPDWEIDTFLVRPPKTKNPDKDICMDFINFVLDEKETHEKAESIL